MTRKLAFANQKGGVGKTAVTLGVASAIADRGEMVLIVDLDPQANSTTGVGVEAEDGGLTGYDVITAAAKDPNSNVLAEAVVETPWDNVHIVPSGGDLAHIESHADAGIVYGLANAIEALDLSRYAAILIDCPPGLGKLLFTALCAADGVVVVTEAAADSVRGVVGIQQTIETVRRRPNPRLRLERIVINKRRNLGEHNYRESELRAGYGDLVSRTVIPDRSAWQNAHSVTEPIHSFRDGMPLRGAFTDLWTELDTEGVPA